MRIQPQRLVKMLKIVSCINWFIITIIFRLRMLFKISDIRDMINITKNIGIILFKVEDIAGGILSLKCNLNLFIIW